MAPTTKPAPFSASMQNIHLLGTGSGSGSSAGSVAGAGAGSSLVSDLRSGGVRAAAAKGGEGVAIKSGNFLTASNIQHTAQVESWRRDYLKVIDRQKELEQLRPNRLKKSSKKGDNDDHNYNDNDDEDSYCHRRHNQYHETDSDDGIQEIQIEIPMEYVNKWHRNNTSLNKKKSPKDSKNPSNWEKGGNGGGGTQTMV